MKKTILLSSLAVLLLGGAAKTETVALVCQHIGAESGPPYALHFSIDAANATVVSWTTGGYVQLPKTSHPAQISDDEVRWNEVTANGGISVDWTLDRSTGQATGAYRDNHGGHGTNSYNCTKDTKLF